MRLIILSIMSTLMLSIVVNLLPCLSTNIAEAQESAVSEDTQSDKPVKAISVIYILDCSYSMSQKFELGAGKPGAIPRLDAAREALESVLNELAERDGPARSKVGVWFFGHRVGWAREGKRIRNPSAADGKPIPTDLAPGEDVESILSLGFFDPIGLGVVRKRLKRVEPLGLSPVNLTILKALEEFVGRGGADSKSIVVIGDGNNDQWHSISSGLKPIVPVSEKNVIEAWKRLDMRIPIFIVALEKPGGAPATSEIAEATGGKILQAANRADLVKILRDLNKTQ